MSEEEFKVGEYVAWDEGMSCCGKVVEVRETHCKVKVDFRMFFKLVRKSRLRHLREDEYTAYWSKVRAWRKF